MSEIKALEKLREKIRLDVNNPWSDLKGDLLAMCDKVEREIAERYMELPVDAEGVPIHMDDMLKSENASKPFIVESMTFADSWTVWDRENGATRWPSECHHVKPRTIEDVLHDAGVSIAAISDVAAEIRELLRGDAE